MNKEILVSYKDLPYGIKREGLSNFIPITEEKYEELKGSLEHIVYDI